MTHPGLDVQAAVQLTASLNGVSARLDRDSAEQKKLNQAINFFPTINQAVPLSGGAGTLDMPALLGPPTGQAWDIKRIAALGFTAGTVNVYINNVNGELLVPFAQAGVSTFTSQTAYLVAGQRLVFSASGISGTVTVSIAGIHVPVIYEGAYLL